jgi:integrase
VPAVPSQLATRREGIYPRHARACGSRRGRVCDCKPRYQAQAWSARDRTPIRKTFRTVSEARAWRQDTQAQLRRGTLRAPTRTTLTEAAEDWLHGAQAGLIRTRSGDPYKPSALRSYEEALRGKLLPELGRLRLSAVTRTDVQDLVDQLVAAGQAPSTVRNAILPLRAIYRRALQRQEVVLNPTCELELPAVRGRRERVARPAEAHALLAALPETDRAIWATALYAGLRRGELQALRWQDVDTERGLIHVERSWDQRTGPIEPKSRSGRRRVPLGTPLRGLLLEHRLAQGRGGSGLALGARSERAFHPGHLARRARAAWRAAGLQPIGLHECRHTYAAFMIAAGVNAKALSAYMGHSSITVTLDRYGHLMPGAEGEAAAMLDAYLARTGA